MRICFVVADIRTQQPSYAGVYLALAAHRCGHDVRFVAVENLSFLDDNNVLATTTRVRAGSRMYLSDFPADVRTKTLVSRSKPRLKQFLRALDGPAVLKPLAPRGG